MAIQQVQNLIVFVFLFMSLRQKTYESMPLPSYHTFNILKFCLLDLYPFRSQGDLHCTSSSYFAHNSHNPVRQVGLRGSADLVQVIQWDSENKAPESLIVGQKRASKYECLLCLTESAKIYTAQLLEKKENCSLFASGHSIPVNFWPRCGKD